MSKLDNELKIIEECIPLVQKKLDQFTGSKSSDDYYVIEDEIQLLMSGVDVVRKNPTNQNKRKALLRQLNQMAKMYDEICEQAPEDMAEEEKVKILECIQRLGDKLEDTKIDAGSEKALISLFTEVNALDDRKHAEVISAKKAVIKCIQDKMYEAACARENGFNEIQNLCEEFQDITRSEAKNVTAPLVKLLVKTSLSSPNMDNTRKDLILRIQSHLLELIEEPQRKEINQDVIKNAENDKNEAILENSATSKPKIPPKPARPNNILRTKSGTFRSHKSDGIKIKLTELKNVEDQIDALKDSVDNFDGNKKSYEEIIGRLDNFLEVAVRFETGENSKLKSQKDIVIRLIEHNKVQMKRKLSFWSASQYRK